MTERYNGWTNYETWNASLWMDNDDGYWRNSAENAMRDAGYDKDAATLELACEMEDVHEDAMPAVEGMYADLLGAAMSRINWYEIAKHYIDEVDVEEPDDIEE